MTDDAAPPPLSSAARETLTCVLDEIIPPSHDGRLPGAGELGLAEPVWKALQTRPELRPALAQGLAALDERARERRASRFAALPGADRRPVLEQVGADVPAFLPGLVLQTCAAYYEDARVLRAHGHEARPPYPAGFEVDPTDFSILDPVRRRPKLYRRP